MFGTIVWVIIAVLIGLFIFRVGFMMLRSLGTPLPAPPPAGEMRRVKIQYRCSICGTEVRMTLATDELPDPPRHCQEDMELVAPIE
jgi:DNA-directed RNA polymerase subunit RPC12/RpoP